jgi:alanine racemase
VSSKPLTYAEVNLDAVASNVSAIKRHIGSAVVLIAVVKANAYGHGALEVARTALSHGAERLAVARIEEGIQLRAAGLTAPILIMNYTPPEHVGKAVDHDLTLTLTELPAAERLSQQAQSQGKTVQVHVKVDTGMGRFGLLPHEVVPFVEQLAALPNIEMEGLYSHFAVADLVDKTYTWQQFELFETVLDRLHTAGHQVSLRHIANSAATLDLPAVHLDAVRVGIALYGLRPSDEVEPALLLKSALTLKSQVARVRSLPAGASISYGRTYITPRPMSVALVPVGYGDGYHRLISNHGAVLIHGQRAPVVGRVCMDQFVVDISEIDSVVLGDEVVLIGCQQQACITAEEVAHWAGTINYEVTTALLPRVARFFL